MDVFNEAVDEARIKHLAKITAVFFKELVDEGIPYEYACEITCSMFYAAKQNGGD